MKKILILIAAIAALSSCVEHTRRTSSTPTKKVRVKYLTKYANTVYVGKVTSIIEVDSMYTVGDTILHSSSNMLYVIIK
jgi:hypothetical protein